MVGFSTSEYVPQALPAEVLSYLARTVYLNHVHSLCTMAKTAKLKKSSKPSTHSRASRRASSPSLKGNLDKFLTNAPRPPSSTTNVLAPQSGSGISKVSKKKGGKILKRKQKHRLEQGKERAEAVSEKLERKVARAKQMREGKKGRNVRLSVVVIPSLVWRKCLDIVDGLTGRCCYQADWDELNEKISGRKKSKKDKTREEEDGWEDEDMEVDGDAQAAPDEQINVHKAEPIQEGPPLEGMRVDIPDEAEDSIR